MRFKNRRLTKVEKRAIRSAVKVYLHCRKIGYPKTYLLGLNHGIKTMADCLPHARGLERMDKLIEATERIFAAHEKRKPKTI